MRWCAASKGKRNVETVALFVFQTGGIHSIGIVSTKDRRSKKQRQQLKRRKCVMLPELWLLFFFGTCKHSMQMCNPSITTLPAERGMPIGPFVCDRQAGAFQAPL